MKNVKMKVKNNHSGDNIVITCHEMVCDLKSISAQIDISDINKLLLSQSYELEYEHGDLVTKCNNAKIVKYQVDDESYSRSFVKFAYDNYTVKKSKYTVLRDTIENLLNTSDSNFISINLERQAGHTSTLLWLMNKSPDAILIVRSFEAKNRIKKLIGELRYYDIYEKNIVVLNEGANIPATFEGRKFKQILIDDFSLFSKNCLEKIIYHTKDTQESPVRYICLG